MSDPVFQAAFNRVRSRHSDRAWFALSPREITDSIYQEIRSLDRERAARDEINSESKRIAAE